MPLEAWPEGDHHPIWMVVALFFALSGPKVFAHASIHGDRAGKIEEAARIFGGFFVFWLSQIVVSLFG